MITLIDRPMDLEDFLQKYGSSLRNHRAFYIVEPLLEKDKTIKFGVSGMNSGNAYQRLSEYLIVYGKRTKTNDCKGVIVHYVGVTEYNRLVQPERSQVYLLEKHLKAEYKSVTEPGRGTERVPKSKLADIIKFIRTKQFRDIETTLRNTNRETTKKYQKDKNSFVDTKPAPKTRIQKKK